MIAWRLSSGATRQLSICPKNCFPIHSEFTDPYSSKASELAIIKSMICSRLCKRPAGATDSFGKIPSSRTNRRNNALFEGSAKRGVLDLVGMGCFEEA